MKLLYDHKIFINQNYGGVPRYFFELMDYYYKTGVLKFEFPVVYSENEYLKNTEIAKSVRFFRKSGLLKIGEVRKNLRRLNNVLIKNALKSTKYDIFHPTYYESYYLDYLKNKKLVITIHDMVHEIFEDDFKNDTYNTAEYKKLLAYKADKIIAVSRNTKSDILKFYPDLPEGKIEVIYHGNSFERFNQNSTCNLTLPEKYILFVGNRNLYKNFNLFLTSIAHLLKQDSELKLFIIGSAGISEEEKILFKQLCVESSIIYHRAKEQELPYIYNKALCFVFPSLYEGFGFPILEAFQCGCPVVASQTSSLPEVGQDCCEYFDPKNNESIFEKVELVVKDADLRKNMVNKGLKRAKDFDWKKTALKTYDAYKSILN
ncbi:MAG: hypothetical protein A2X64_07630 [Ignavibacteria bacterium GWF2_33_9]|nr:MAG: hypothetical protein A2X64_07630 [Ignavibacteria bacterium GWF2_33_9]